MKISVNKIVLWVLMALSIIFALMFFCGGSIDPDAEYVEPNFTGLLLNWTYILIGIVCIVTIIAAFCGFLIKLKKDSKSAIVSVVIFLVLALLLLITYTTGDTTHISQLASDIEQDDFSMKVTDMCIKSSAILAFIAVFVTLFGWVAKKF